MSSNTPKTTTTTTTTPTPLYTTKPVDWTSKVAAKADDGHSDYGGPPHKAEWGNTYPKQRKGGRRSRKSKKSRKSRKSKKSRKSRRYRR